ncbi:MAG: hypothetical protein ABS36_16375 [Acidobacteria bacterium SCN 69-37]|nr:MAG: hypothetical protein ABS36_16375 [Acidobacteria bacterium SCN 69-37]
MTSRRLIAPLIVLASLPVLAASLPAQSAVEQAIADAAQYLRVFGDQASGVVLEERYLQQAQGRVVSARELVSDLAIMADPQFGWVEFRDVYVVDGTEIPDRQDRVVELFAHPSADGLAQAQRIAQEGARHNLTPVGVQFARTLNLPMAALMYLRAENQSRSRFRRESLDSVAGHRVLIVRFEEQATPRLIGSVDNAPARGRFWIEPGTGRVLRSELEINSRRGTTNVQALIEVEYSESDDLGLWLPRQMEETYEFTDGMGRQLAHIFGRAVYNNVRKFRVDIEENVDEDELMQDTVPQAVAPTAAAP